MTVRFALFLLDWLLLDLDEMDHVVQRVLHRVRHTHILFVLLNCAEIVQSFVTFLSA